MLRVEEVMSIVMTDWGSAELRGQEEMMVWFK